MADAAPDTEPLRRECRTFCRYLAGRDPDVYVMETWLRAHARGPRVLRDLAGPFDRFLVRMASRGRWMARALDAYAAVFARRSRLRVKLVVLLAILETTGRGAGELDSPDASSRARFFARAVFLSVVFGAVVLGALVVVTPLRIVLALGGAQGGGR